MEPGRDERSNGVALCCAGMVREPRGEMEGVTVVNSRQAPGTHKGVGDVACCPVAGSHLAALLLTRHTLRVARESAWYIMHLAHHHPPCTPPQVTLLSDLVGAGLRSVSHSAAGAQLLAVLLTVWLISLAVAALRGWQRLCASRNALLLVSVCWPLRTGLLDVPTSTRQVRIVAPGMWCIVVGACCAVAMSICCCCGHRVRAGKDGYAASAHRHPAGANSSAG